MVELFELVNNVFRLRTQVVVEGFDDGALLLCLDDRRLIELNATARDVLAQTDGQRSVAQVAAALAEEYQIAEAEALQDTTGLYELLVAQGIVEAVIIPRMERKKPK